MKSYEAAFQSPNAAAAGCLGQLWAPTRQVRVLEVGIGTANTAIDIGLFRTSARGTVSTSFNGEALDGNDEASTGIADRLFTVDPTFSGNDIAAWSAVGTVGLRDIIWEFYNQQLWIPVSQGVGLKNLAALTSQGHEIYFVWEE